MRNNHERSVAPGPWPKRIDGADRTFECFVRHGVRVLVLQPALASRAQQFRQAEPHQVGRRVRIPVAKSSNQSGFRRRVEPFGQRSVFLSPTAPSNSIEPSTDKTPPRYIEPATGSVSP
jgi:hypothetical protein